MLLSGRHPAIRYHGIDPVCSLSQLPMIREKKGKHTLGHTEKLNNTGEGKNWILSVTSNNCSTLENSISVTSALTETAYLRYGLAV